MKSSEIIVEQQLDELGWKDIPGMKTVAKVGAAAKGLATPGATMAGGWRREAYTQQIEAMAKRTMPAWNQQEAALEAQGISGPAVGEALQRWATQYFKIQAPEPPPMVDDAGAFEYIKKCIAMKMAPQAAAAPTGGAPTTATTSPAPADTAPAPSGAAAAADAVSGNSTATAPTEPAPAAPTTPAAPAANPAHEIFKDPAKFKAEWDKFVASQPGFKMITDPDLQNALKQMWMRAGGTRVESKNNKGKRV